MSLARREISIFQLPSASPNWMFYCIIKQIGNPNQDLFEFCYPISENNLARVCHCIRLPHRNFIWLSFRGSSFSFHFIWKYCSDSMPSFSISTILSLQFYWFFFYNLPEVHRLWTNFIWRIHFFYLTVWCMMLLTGNWFIPCISYCFEKALD